MNSVVGKLFFIDEEEYEVLRLSLYGEEYICVSLMTDHEEHISKEFVESKVRSYEQDKLELEKEYEAIRIKEEDEKELLKKIIRDYDKNKLSIKELKTLINIYKVMGLEE